MAVFIILTRFGVSDIWHIMKPQIAELPYFQIKSYTLCYNEMKLEITEMEYTEPNNFVSYVLYCSENSMEIVIVLLIQSPQSTDQNIQVKVVGVESVGSAVNVVKVGKRGENTNSDDIENASHYPCDVCHTLMSTATNTECWTIW